MVLKTCASEVQKSEKKGRQDNKQPVMHFEEPAGKMVRHYHWELPHTAFIIMICGVSNGSIHLTPATQPQAFYSDMTHCEMIVFQFVEIHSGVKEPKSLPWEFSCTLEQDKLDKDYVGFHRHGPMWITPFVDKFHVTVAFGMLSCWNFTIIWCCCC